MITKSLESQLYLRDARKICLIKPSALGDIVQTLPLLPVLKARFPKAEISWVVNQNFQELLEDHPMISQVIPFNRYGGWKDWWALLKRLRQENFDLVFDLQGLLRTAVMTAATGSPKRIGLETAREFSHFACHDLISETSREVPAHERIWRVAEVLGMRGFTPETVVPIGQKDYLSVQKMLSAVPGPFIAIHAGAQWVTKRWPVEKFAEVASQAMRMHNVSVVILGSPGEKPLGHQLERQIRQRRSGGHVLDLTGQTTLKQLAAVLERAEVLLTNDSGPMHLAAGLSVPLVGVFSSTDSLRSGPPPSDLSSLVSTTVACRGCYKKKCPKSGDLHLKCLQELEPGPVWNALHQMLTKLRTRSVA